MRMASCAISSRWPSSTSTSKTPDRDLRMALYELDGIRVEVPANARYWVADNATVLGRVLIEEDASIWFNAVLRGDTEPIRIGARANVQDGCVLHTDVGFPLLVGAEA